MGAGSGGSLKSIAVQFMEILLFRNLKYLTISHQASILSMLLPFFFNKKLNKNGKVGLAIWCKTQSETARKA